MADALPCVPAGLLPPPAVLSRRRYAIGPAILAGPIALRGFVGLTERTGGVVRLVQFRGQGQDRRAIACGQGRVDLTDDIGIAVLVRDRWIARVQQGCD